MSFNKIIVVGNLGRDPELRYTPQGTAVCSFTLATNEKRRDKSGEQADVVTWFRVTLWKNAAENASKYLRKGTPVYIEGRLRVEEWTDRENNNRYTLEINGTDMQFIGSKSDNEGGGSYAGGSGGGGEQPELPAYSGSDNAGPLMPATPPPADDDIPF